MIRVTTLLQQDRREEADACSDPPGSWRVHSCTIEFGIDAAPVTLLCNWVYASPVAAQQDMQERALEQLHLRGYTGSDEIIWRVHTIEN